jgi:hypothetical protein
VYDEGGWPVHELEDEAGFLVSVEGSAGDWSALVLTDDDHDRFAFYSLSPVDTPPEKIPAMAELLHRANHGLLTATFELDHDTGEVRLRTAIDLATLPRRILEEQELLDGLVLDLSAANVGVFDAYLSAIVAVTTSDVTPAEIVREIEGPAEDED